jgi:D-alanine-D-alanine ligase
MTDAQQGRKLRVTVLMGGNSSEREISLATGTMIVSALDRAKYEVSAIDTRDLATLARPASPMLLSGTTSEVTTTGTESPCPVDTVKDAATEEALVPAPERTEGTEVLTPLVTATERQGPDLIFIALHGKGGEDGAVQGMLETLGLPYTGSGVLASALAMDKSMAKRLFRSVGLPVIADFTVAATARPPDDEMVARVTHSLDGFPVFVKPNAEGSTFGGSLVREAGQLGAAVDYALRYDRLALIEKYVRGREVTVGVLGNTGETLEVLPVVEIVPRGEYYDHDSKYATGGSEHIIPARLSPEQTERAQEIALQCHRLLGCRGMSRTDMIVTDTGLHLLEVNTIPGMTPTSLLPDAAAHAGISFPALLDRLIEYALSR